MFSKEAWLDIWEGNRRLTIRTVEAFPDDQLFHFKPAEPLRPFGEMVIEIINLERVFIRGIAQGQWTFDNPFGEVKTKADLLAACESVRIETRTRWGDISEERLKTVEDDPLFGGPPQSHFDRLFYALENEIHHRGQGYIYLRLLGITPPAFYER